MFLKKLDGLIGSMLINLFPRPRKPGEPPVSVKKLLLVRPGGIGDAAFLIPAIRLLQVTFPQASIEVLAERRNSAVFALCPKIARVLNYDRPRELMDALKGGYDVVIDSEQWHRLSALVARMVRAPVKIGYATNERSRMFTHGIAYSHDDHELDSFRALLGPLGISDSSGNTTPFLVVPDKAQSAADALLGEIKDVPFVVIFPGASIPERCWGSDRYHQLAKRLEGAGNAVAVVGGREDIAAGAAIASGTGALNLAGKTSLLETAGVLRRAKLLVSGDSGVLHIGVGLGLPTVSLFGPGIAKKWAPRGPQHRVLNHNLPCSPCTKFGTTPPCPIGVRCMQEITVDEVFAAVREVLRDNAEKVIANAL